MHAKFSDCGAWCSGGRLNGRKKRAEIGACAFDGSQNAGQSLRVGTLLRVGNLMRVCTRCRTCEVQEYK